MLSKTDNEFLTRSGKGTPMGALLRRFWMPALLSEELPERVSGLLGKLREAEREIASMRQQQALAAGGRIADGAADVGGVSVVVHDVGDGTTPDDLRTMVLDVRARLGADRPTVVAMTTVNAGKPVVVVATNEAARARGLKAGALVRVAAAILGGGGGGKDDLAQGGGTDGAATAASLVAVRDAVAHAAQ